MNIILTRTEQKMNFYYDSDIINMEDIESDNRGRISVIIYTNLLDNTFYIDLNLSYLTNDSSNNNSLNNSLNNNSSNNIPNNNSTSNSKLSALTNKIYNYADNYKPEIAAGVATSGLLGVGTLFLAGLLGGKIKTRKKRKMGQNKK